MAAATAPARIAICDTTLLGDPDAPGAAIARSDRLPIAELLAGAGVDCIEAGIPATSASAADAVAEIARHVRTTRIAARARCSYADIETTAAALAGARAPRIHLVFAGSDRQLRTALGITPADAVQRVRDCVRFARRFTDDVAFSAGDAGSELTFVAELFSAAIDSGAATVILQDCAGRATPRDMAAAIRSIVDRTTGIDRATLGVCTSNDLGRATANAFAAVLAGARHVECAVGDSSKRAGVCALEDIVSALPVLGDASSLSANVRPAKLADLCLAVARATAIPLNDRHVSDGFDTLVGATREPLAVR